MMCNACGFQAPFEVFLVRGGRLLCSMCGGENVTSPSSHIVENAIATGCVDIRPNANPQFVGADPMYQPAVYVASESDVKSEKDSIKRYIDSTDLSVRHCGSIPAPDRQGWEDFRDEFYRFYIEKEGSVLPWVLTPIQSTLILREQYQKAQHYREELANWQTRLAPYCSGNVGPSITDLQPTDPGILDRLSRAEKDAHDTATTFTKYALWGGLGLLAVLGFIAFTSRENVGKALDKVKFIPV